MLCVKRVTAAENWDSRKFVAGSHLFIKAKACNKTSSGEICVVSILL